MSTSMLTATLTAHATIARVAEEAHREYLTEKLRREALEGQLERWYSAFEANIDSDPFEVATRVRRDDSAWQKATGCDRPQDAKLQSLLELQTSTGNRRAEQDARRIAELEAHLARFDKLAQLKERYVALEAAEARKMPGARVAWGYTSIDAARQAARVMNKANGDCGAKFGPDNRSDEPCIVDTKPPTV